jgi:hypothetical protein
LADKAEPAAFKSSVAASPTCRQSGFIEAV